VSRDESLNSLNTQVTHLSDCCDLATIKLLILAIALLASCPIDQNWPHAKCRSLICVGLFCQQFVAVAVVVALGVAVATVDIY